MNSRVLLPWLLCLLLTACRPEADRGPIHVEPGMDIVQVVAEAPAGAELLLAPGEYVLLTTLEITRDITLRGESPNTVKIVKPAEQSFFGESPTRTGRAFVYIRGASFTASGVSFEYHHGDYIHMIRAEDAIVDLSDCRVYGASIGYKYTLEYGGYGVWLRGASTGTVRNCTLSWNIYAGLHVDDTSEATVEGCHIEGGQGAGIEFSGESRGTVRNNTVSRYGSSVLRGWGRGIWAWGGGPFLIEGNHVSDTRGWGIGVRNGTVRNNTVEATGAGLWADDPALIEANVLRNATTGLMNSPLGMSISHAAAGKALIRGNVVELNGWHGIWLQDTSAPELRDNTVRANGGCGIRLSQQASPTPLPLEANNPLTDNTGGAVCDERTP